ncbi:MAG: hypothetical protein D6696_18345 [Acidobacteria bacterium]|nr:MAG: hypothetical protein D6696_18345 [Acidobacteriota bacterium]
MAGRRDIDRLRQATAGAVARHARQRRALTRRAGRPPAAGELYVLPATRSFAVEWAVIRCDEATGRVLLMAADAAPVRGPCDLEVAPADGGPLTLRGRCHRWLPAARLAGGERSGLLSPPALDAARRLLDRPAGGSASSPGEEPEYRRWVATVLEPAVAALGKKPEPSGDV